MLTQPLDITSILVQVPLVAAFIWFALRLNHDHQRTLDKLIGDSRSANIQVMADWRNYLKDRDDQWRLFLVEQRDSQNATLDSFAQRLEEISRVVAELDRHVRGKDE